MVKHDAAGVLPLAQFATIEDVLTGLRERGGRATPARRLLLAALFRDRHHRSAEELADEVQAQSPDVNISTIYRNLDELVRLGVVDRSHLGGGPAAYHLASATHGHLVCGRCGAMTEVPGELFRDIAATLASRYGFAVDPHRFGVIGRCADCQRHDTGQLPIVWTPGTTCTYSRIRRSMEICPVTAFTVQGMDRVRPGQALAWSLSCDRSVRHYAEDPGRQAISPPSLRWRPATKPKSSPATDPGPASRPASSGRARRT